MNVDNIIENVDKIMEDLIIDFIEKHIENKYTKQEATDHWEILENTYRDYLAKFNLPGALDNYTDKDILEYLKSCGELKKIKEVALNRLDSLK
jgi:hypothetical protein